MAADTRTWTCPPFPRSVVIAAVNDEAILARNLAASPIVASGRAAIDCRRGAVSASAAYNAGIDAGHAADLLIFAHQDVYFPEPFEAGLAAAVAELDARDPDWAVLGVFGVDTSDRHAGRVWSSGLGRALEMAPATPVPAQSLDELVIVLRASAGLRFDEALPHFHLYGTDIVQIARAAGRGAWIADLPVIHNSRFVARLGPGFAAAYRHLQRKWAGRLPLKTPVLRITRWGVALIRAEASLRRSRARRARAAASSETDPATIARRLGWAGPAGGATP